MPLSIEIRLKEIVLVDTKTKKGKFSLINPAIIPLESGWIDAKGINDLGAVAESIRHMLEYSNITTKHCTLCINNNSVIYREMTIPKIEDKRLPMIIRNEMIASLDLSSDHIVDFVVLEEFSETGKLKLRVLGVAILKSALGTYVDLVNKLNLRITAIDTATTAVINLVNRSRVADNGEPVLIADIQADLMKLYLFEKKKYVMVRSFRLPDEQEKEKAVWIGDLEDNINKMLQYQFTRESHMGVGRVYFFGDHPWLMDIKDSVSESLSIDTLAFPMNDLLLTSTPTDLSYLNAIGALLRK